MSVTGNGILTTVLEIIVEERGEKERKLRP